MLCPWPRPGRAAPPCPSPCGPAPAPAAGAPGRAGGASRAVPVPQQPHAGRGPQVRGGLPLLLGRDDLHGPVQARLQAGASPRGVVCVAGDAGSCHREAVMERAQCHPQGQRSRGHVHPGIPQGFFCCIPRVVPTLPGPTVTRARGCPAKEAADAAATCPGSRWSSCSAQSGRAVAVAGDAEHTLDPGEAELLGKASQSCRTRGQTELFPISLRKG